MGGGQSLSIKLKNVHLPHLEVLLRLWIPFVSFVFTLLLQASTGNLKGGFCDSSVGGGLSLCLASLAVELSEKRDCLFDLPSL